MGSTGASRRVNMAFSPSSATTLSMPRRLGYSSRSSSAFFRTGESTLARKKAAELPTVAPKALMTAPCSTPPNSTPAENANTMPPASKQNTLTNVQPRMKRAASTGKLSSAALLRTMSMLSLSSGLSWAKFSPSPLTSAALPPTRSTTAPNATTKAVRVRADLPSLLIGLPVSGSSSGTMPLLRRKLRSDSALLSMDRIW